MSINYFKAFAEYLRDYRDDADIKIESIAAATRMKTEWIKKIENADFGFAPKVFISGYLRKYAQYIGLNPDDVIRQYELILEKIDYVAQEGYVERSPLDSNWSSEDLFSEAHESEISSFSVQLDEEISKKIDQEKKDTRMVMSAGGVLILLCLGYVFFDSSFSSISKESGNLLAEKNKFETAGAAKTRKPVRRLRWDLSEPLLTEQEKLAKDEEARQGYLDSTEESRNLVSVTVENVAELRPISVQEAASDLEQKLNK